MTERHVGVDLAKAIAIYFVVVFHFVTFGQARPTAGAGFYIGAYVNALAWCCVDLFGLVSGYLGVVGHPHVRKWAKLWLQVFVISVFMTVFCRFAFSIPVGGHDFVHQLMPVSSSTYWYFTAYTGLYCLMPVLNAGLRALDHRQTLGVAAALMIVLSCLASIGPRDVYGLNSGHSVLWLTVLYVLGAVIRLHLPRLPRVRWCLLAAALLSGVTTVQLVLVAKHPAFAERAGILPKMVNGQVFERVLAGHFISPVVLLTAVAILLACLQLKAATAFTCKVLTFLSTTAFGVYLFHDHPSFHYGVLRDGLASLGRFGDLHPALWLPIVLGLAFGLHLACAVLEKGRQLVMGRVLR